MDDEQIFSIFNHRCIVCFKPATEMNHILLRSRSNKSSDWKNKAPLCRTHHEAYHDGGVTLEKTLAMQARRVEVLYMLGRQEYA